MFYGAGPHEQGGFLFIHIPKTAGTSIFTAMLKSCQGTRAELNHYRMGQKKHASAFTARGVLTPAQWNHAFKFSVVRNPWDRMVSMWRYGRRQTRLKGGVRVLHTLNVPLNEIDAVVHGILTKPFPWWIHEFCRRYRWFPAHNHQSQPPYIKGDPPPQTAWFTDPLNGSTVLDKIYRFENLAELEHDLAAILGQPFVLPHLNPSETGPYAAHYDPETHDWVARVFAADIKRYGYKFDEP
jgi:hypothetical protein